MTVSQSLDQYDDERILWHNKLGHLNEKGLFGGYATRKDEPGEDCVQEIQCRVKFSLVQHSRKEIIECVHSDLWAPFPMMSHGGCEYL